MILVDTNILVAAARTADRHHFEAAELLDTLTEPLLVPPTVIAEVCYRLNEWDGPALKADFLRNFSPSRPEVDRLHLAELHAGDLDRRAALVEQYVDMPLGTDTSLVAIAERRGIDTVATFDRRHFTCGCPRAVLGDDVDPGADDVGRRTA